MSNRLRNLILLIAVLFVCLPVMAQQKLLTLDEIYSPDPKVRVNFNGNPPTGLRWMKDGIHYLWTKRPPGAERTQGAGAPAGQLMRVNAMTGEEEPFFDAAKMEAAFAKLPGISSEQAKQVAHRGNYEMNADATSALVNFSSDLFYYPFGGDTAVRLTNNLDPEEDEEFSPDGKLVAFVRNNNLYVVDVATQKERALTSDGNATHLNGRLDWVYQEEIYGRGNYGAFWWSPDSTKLAYLRLDESRVKNYPVVDHIPYDQVLEDTKYPISGEPNPSAELGVVNSAGGATRWVNNFKYQGGEFLITRVGWTPDSKKLVYEIQDREQTWLDLNVATSPDSPQTLIHEASKAWVNVSELPTWLKDGSFLWESERTGWSHLYHYSAEGKLVGPVTSGEWEVRKFFGVDEDNGFAYFSSNEYNQVGNQAYRVKLDGTGRTRITQGEGNHNPNFNSKFSLFIDSWSDVHTPTQVRLYKP
ncbi:MAG: DPP IV N-terminal domain-containing protein, partial [Terriglobia bacterium]